MAKVGTRNDRALRVARAIGAGALTFTTVFLAVIGAMTGRANAPLLPPDMPGPARSEYRP